MHIILYFLHCNQGYYSSSGVIRFISIRFFLDASWRIAKNPALIVRGPGGDVDKTVFFERPMGQQRRGDGGNSSASSGFPSGIHDPGNPNDFDEEAALAGLGA